MSLVLVVIWAILIQGCLSYRMVSQVDGAAITPDDKTLLKGQTTLDELLQAYGAPQQVIRIHDQMALIYRRQTANDRRLSLSIPIIYQALNPTFDISASGALVRQDILVLILTPQGVLDHYVFARGTTAPFLKTLIGDR